MSFDIPTDRRYLESHEWVKLEDGTARVGISDFAQDELGDIVFVEVPPIGEEITQEETTGVIESIKAVSDMYAPISGTVTAVNEEIETTPELINEDPYGEGWLFELEVADEAELDSLLDPEAYEASLD